MVWTHKHESTRYHNHTAATVPIYRSQYIVIPVPRYDVNSQTRLHPTSQPYFSTWIPCVESEHLISNIPVPRYRSQYIVLWGPVSLTDIHWNSSRNINEYVMVRCDFDVVILILNVCVCGKLWVLSFFSGLLEWSGKCGKVWELWGKCGNWR